MSSQQPEQQPEQDPKHTDPGFWDFHKNKKPE